MMITFLKYNLEFKLLLNSKYRFINKSEIYRYED